MVGSQQLQYDRKYLRSPGIKLEEAYGKRDAGQFDHQWEPRCHARVSREAIRGRTQERTWPKWRNPVFSSVKRLRKRCTYSASLVSSTHKPAERLWVENEEQQNERTMSFYKKLVASDMTLATSVERLRKRCSLKALCCNSFLILVHLFCSYEANH